MNDNEIRIIAKIILIVFILIFYFLPIIIAKSRHVRSFWGIFFVNLFFGLTGIGYIMAFIWAIVSERKEKYIVN